MTATSQSSKSGRQLLTELPARYRGLSPLCTIYKQLMTTIVDAWDTDFAPGEVDTAPNADGIETELSALEIAGLAVAGVTALNGVAVLTAAAPAYTAVMGAGATVLGWTGYRKRNGLPVIPGQATEDTTPATVAAPQPVAVASTPPITDRAGQEVNPEYI